MQMHWNQKSNIYLNIWLALCPSQCNYFLVFDIDLIRWTLLQSKRTVFVGQNLKAKRSLCGTEGVCNTIIFIYYYYQFILWLQKLMQENESIFASSFGHWIQETVTYFLHPAKTVCLAFKFCPTKAVRLDCSKVHLIKAISNTKKELHWERHEANQMFTFLVPMHLHLLRIWKSNKHHGLQSQVL